MDTKVRESPYKIEELSDGFVISGKDRVTTTVKLLRDGFSLNSRRLCGLYNYYGLSEHIAESLMSEWIPVEGKKPWKGLREWVRHQTAQAIGKRVYHQWERLLKEVDPVVLDVQRAIFAANFGRGSSGMPEELYRDEMVVKDICTYKAAAIAAAHIDDLINNYAERIVLNSQPAIQLVTLAGGLGRTVRIIVGEKQEKDLSGEDRVNALRNWRNLFSVTGESYRSLDRTLMNLPNAVPSDLVCDLNKIRLERPMTNRTEFITAMLCAANESLANRDVLIDAKESQIKEAAKRASGYTHANYNMRKAKSIKALAMFLTDYPERHNGNIVGLADKCVEWHRDGQTKQIQKTLKELGGETKTVLPPIGLPDLPDIRFLSDVESIVQEAEVMQHCIASYAERAAMGQCFLFHVDHDGEMASVEILRDGKMGQSYGPHDTENKASSFGKRVLSRWGKGFPKFSEEYPQYPDIQINRHIEWVGDEEIPF